MSIKNVVISTHNVLTAVLLFQQARISARNATNKEIGLLLRIIYHVCVKLGFLMLVELVLHVVLAVNLVILSRIVSNVLSELQE